MKKHTHYAYIEGYTAKRSRIFYSKKIFNERKNDNNEKRSEASKRIDEAKVGFLVSMLLNVMENSVFVSMGCFWEYVLYVIFLYNYVRSVHMRCDLLNLIIMFVFFFHFYFVEPLNGKIIEIWNLLILLIMRIMKMRRLLS